MSKFDTCPCSGINLDKLIQPAILLILQKEDLHGYTIIQKIGENPLLNGKKPDPTGVYRHLKDMEKRNLIEGVWDTPDQGNAKRLYKITVTGKECFSKWFKSLTNYSNSLINMLQEMEQFIQ